MATHFELSLIRSDQGLVVCRHAWFLSKMSNNFFFLVGSRSDFFSRAFERVVIDAAPVKSMILAKGTSY